jgi:hypothetical protein
LLYTWDVIGYNKKLNDVNCELLSYIIELYDMRFGLRIKFSMSFYDFLIFCGNADV